MKTFEKVKCLNWKINSPAKEKLQIVEPSFEICLPHAL